MSSVRFIAALKDTGHAIKIDAEGQGEILLIVCRTEITKALPLVAMGGKNLVVEISEEKELNPKKKSIDEWAEKKKK